MPAPMIETGAVLQPPYRYLLWRVWDEHRERVTFVMLNPSTADADTDDPTLRRCLAFAQAWGYGSLSVVNLYGYQTSELSVLWRIPDPVGPKNDAYVQEAMQQTDTIVVAWGAAGAPPDRVRAILSILEKHQRPLLCLGQTKHGCPRHPLYLPSTTERWPFLPPAWLTQSLSTSLVEAGGKNAPGSTQPSVPARTRALKRLLLWQDEGGA